MGQNDLLLSIQGPITPISPFVTVLGGGINPVQLFSDAGVVLSAAVAGDGVSASVQPTQGALKPGINVVARWISGEFRVGRRRRL